MLENSTIQIQIKQMCKASYNLAEFYQTNGVHKKWTQVEESIEHKFLNTPYKNRSRYIIPSKTNHNHQRDQHGYQRNQEKKIIKNTYGRKF